jgi:hypothetical protein
MTTTIIQMGRGSASDAGYGILFVSDYVYPITGRGVHNPEHPHRIQVWDNTIRPNTNPDEPTQSGGKRGPGRYISPDGKGTDNPISVLAAAEVKVWDRYGTSTGTPGSGQQFEPVMLRPGSFVVLAGPTGALSDPMQVTARSLADPELVPLGPAPAGAGDAIRELDPPDRAFHVGAKIAAVRSLLTASTNGDEMTYEQVKLAAVESR